jgi:hypothetical protein
MSAAALAAAAAACLAAAAAQVLPCIDGVGGPPAMCRTGLSPQGALISGPPSPALWSQFLPSFR